TPHEIKTSEKKTERPKLHHVMQAQAQMLVTGADRVRLVYFQTPIKRPEVMALTYHFENWRNEDREYGRPFSLALAEILIGRGQIAVFDIMRDESTIERIAQRCGEFWDAVQTGGPLPDYPPDGVHVVDSEAIELALDRYCADRDNKIAHADVVDLLDVEAALSGINPSRLVCGAYTASKVNGRNGAHWRIAKGDA
ncbi:MAG TPA: hypothetical protein VLB27_11960, partial [candidate division Zixibacteria bacterium]|nr:hypothetical protein [candidate division Zixibacteria bacterium]